MLRNPFIITEEYLDAEYFCDREFESSVLRSNIINGRNTVLISPRRMGKSGLISHVIHQQDIADEYKIFSVDLFPTSTFTEMILLLSNEIVGRMKTHERLFADRFMSVVKSLRPGMKMNPINGELEFNLSLGEIMDPKTSLEEIFQYLQESPEPCIVAVDEFQQIADYPETNVVALLRSHVQKCTNCRFIFAGSSRRMMEKLFNSPSEPFYMSCSPLYLDVIDKDKYMDFAFHHFKNGGKSITKECFSAIYDRFEGHTWYVQRLLNETYEHAEKGSVVDVMDYSRNLDYVIRLYGKSFEEQIQTYSEAQKALLIAIAKEGKVSGVTSMAFVRKHSLKSPSTVQSAIRPLLEREIITREDGKFSITNRFFSIWINRRYSALPL